MVNENLKGVWERERVTRYITMKLIPKIKEKKLQINISNENV